MMFVFLLRRLLLSPVLDANTQFHTLSFKALFSSTCLSSSDSEICERSSNSTEKPSFTVSYLINSCGLSPKAAVSASKRLNFKNPERPDSVLNFLKHNGFNSSQISILVRKRPHLLSSDLSKIIVPKIEFFRSIGVASEELPKFITRNPDLLRWSLKQCIIPTHKFLKTVLHSDDKVVKVFQRLDSHDLYRIRKNTALNISSLKELGVPDRFISSLLHLRPKVLCAGVDKFNEAVQKIIGMGFDPAKNSFTQAMSLPLHMSRKTWAAKVDNFLSWGLSEDQIFSALRKNPIFLELSKKSIKEKMNFLVHEMGLEPDVVLGTPTILCYSFEKRIVPRCAAMKILFLNDLAKTEFNLYSIVKMSEENFLKKYVNQHLKKVPQLVDVVQGKLDPRELGLVFNGKRKA